MTIPFWRWTKDESGERVLFIDGTIAAESWYADDITPQQFRDELFAAKGDVTLWIHSPGGDCFAAAQIYNMLMEYPGNVTVKIDGMAASAASVIAMAGGDVFMSPVSSMVLHDPSTLAMGNADEMVRAKAMLDEVKESIINAYELRTGLSRSRLADMMTAETWLNARKAVELGFADDILYMEGRGRHDTATDSLIFSRQAVTNAMMQKLLRTKPKQQTGTPVESLEKRLNLLSH